MRLQNPNGVFRIAARALIVQDERLLMVSDDGVYWYPPGGRLEVDESLQECVAREVYEETGLTVNPENLLYVLECFDLKDHIHKIHFYFQTTVLEGNLTDNWQDDHGSVQFRRFFTLQEIKESAYILPRFLVSGTWCKPTPQDNIVYQGSVTMRGFEMVGSV